MSYVPLCYIHCFDKIILRSYFSDFFRKFAIGSIAFGSANRPVADIRY